MTNNKNKTKGDNSPIIEGDVNNSHIGDIVYFNQLQEETDDLVIVNKIFKSVIEKIENKEYTVDNQHLNLDDKIKLNFTDSDERNAIVKYCNFAFTKISLIERRLQEEDSETQKDIQSYIFGRYFKLKSEKKSNIDIMHSLFDIFVPKDQKNDEKYIHLAKAFVLFFFEDCTIFEKTEREKYANTN